jgi:hypothetical protein
MLLAGNALAGGEAGRVDVYWPERQWVFVADGRSGAVQALALGRGITPLAMMREPARSGVRAMLLDKAGARLWVLGAHALDVHDAADGRLLAHWRAPEGVELEHLTGSAEAPRASSGAVQYAPLAGGVLAARR